MRLRMIAEFVLGGGGCGWRYRAASWCGLAISALTCQIAVALIVVAQIAATWCGSALGQDSPGQSEPLVVPPAVADFEQAVSAAIEKAEKSVVSILRVRGLEGQAAVFERPFDPFARDQAGALRSSLGDSDFVPSEYGTGVVLDGGLVLTAYHVVDDETAQYWVTTADRRTARAQIKGADPRSDLAVLEVALPNLAPVTLGDAKTVKKGHFVVALGNPYAIARDGQVSASWGIVANVGRKVGVPSPLENRAGKSYYLGGMIQTDARLNLGTSGGALVNLRGEMIGLTTSLAALAGYEQAAGYAIPVDDAFRRIVETLKQGREVEYGFLGVGPADLHLEERARGRQGARIEEVVQGTPAFAAGLQPQDVITAVNGTPVTDRDSLFLSIGNQAVESNVRLTVERNGNLVPVNVVLAKSAVFGRKIITAPARHWRGVHVDFATAVPEFRERLQRNLAHGNVVVTEVEFDGPAALAGLRPGSLITHVDGTRVQTPREFFAAVHAKPAAVKLRLAEELDQSSELVIEPEKK